MPTTCYTFVAISYYKWSKRFT